MYDTTHTLLRIATLLTLLCTSCQRERVDRPDDGQGDEPASLTIDFTVPDATITAATRSASIEETLQDLAGHPGASTDLAARLVDGELIYRITVFIVNYYDNKVVAYRDIYNTEALQGHLPDNGEHEKPDNDDENGFVNSEGAIDNTLKYSNRVRVKFDYEDPKHGDIERFKRGRYALFAVCNWSGGTISSSTFGQVTCAPVSERYRATVQEMIDQFTNEPAGIYPFAPASGSTDDCTPFYNYLLRLNDVEDPDADNPASASYLRHLYSEDDSGQPVWAAQALANSQEIYLQPGTNTIRAEMVRPAARIRIEVCNTNAEYELRVNKLSLSENFAQARAYLFQRLNDLTRNYYLPDGTTALRTGAPEVSSERAIVPFKPYKAGDDNSPGMTIGMRESKPVFDGLIYESYDLTAPYTYTIEVEYPEVTDYVGNEAETAETLDTYAQMGMPLLIRGAYGNFFMYENNGTVYVDKSPQTASVQAASKRYQWELEPAGDAGYYRLKNVDSGSYIASLGTTTGSLTTTASAADADIFTTGSAIANRFWFQSTKASDTRYINLQGGTGSAAKPQSTTSGIITWWEVNDAGSHFALFPLKPQKRETVTLRTIDATTSVVSDVHEIRRNDFIRVLIEVSYNPLTGVIDYQVKDWNEVNGDIEYN